jgi:hypothetical protein
MAAGFSISTGVDVDAGHWMLMAHREIFPDYNQQGAQRDEGKAESVNKDERFLQALLHPAYRVGAYTFRATRDLIQNRVAAWPGSACEVLFETRRAGSGLWKPADFIPDFSALVAGQAGGTAPARHMKCNVLYPTMFAVFPALKVRTRMRHS